jgi:hypothetical protein
MFAYTDQSYEDTRFNLDQWKDIKQNSPLGHVPFLEVIANTRSFKLGQSMSIARCLAKKFDLAGSDELQTGLKCKKLLQTFIMFWI